MSNTFLKFFHQLLPAKDLMTINQFTSINVHNIINIKIGFLTIINYLLYKKKE